MNTQLASVLQEAGRSPADLIRTLNQRLRSKSQPTVHRTTAYKWLSEDSRPVGSNTPELVADILSEWTGKRITVASLGWTRGARVPALYGLSESWGASSTLQMLQKELGDDMDRRVYLAQSGMDLVALSNPWLLDPIEKLTEVKAGRRIGSSVVADINTITSIRRRMDDALGGGTLLAAVREDLKVTIRLIARDSYSSETGKLLYAAVAEQARLASWLAYDTGQYGLAQHYTATALRAAHTAEDRQIGANILGFAAYQDGTRGDAVAAEGLSRAALAGGRGGLTPAVEGSLHARLGMARARVGDMDGAAAAFDAAENLLNRSDSAEEPEWIYWFTPGDLHGIAGESYLAFQRSDIALEHLRQAVAGTPDDLARDKALWLSTMATAWAVEGELEQGHQVAEDALLLLGGKLESERVFGVFSGFCAALDQRDPRSAQGFRDRLIAHVAEGDQLA
jgi:hypothetical protein